MHEPCQVPWHGQAIFRLDTKRVSPKSAMEIYSRVIGRKSNLNHFNLFDLHREHPGSQPFVIGNQVTRTIPPCPLQEFAGSGHEKGKSRQNRRAGRPAGVEWASRPLPGHKQTTGHRPGTATAQAPPETYTRFRAPSADASDARDRL